MRYTYQNHVQWIGIALALVLSSGCIPREATPSVSPSPTAMQSPATPVAVAPSVSATTLTPTTETATPDPAIPLCEFTASAAPEVKESSLGAYTFSEPKVVLTYDDSPIRVVAWVDEQHLLITHLIAANKEAVELLDVESGAVQNYGERRNLSAMPVWLSATHSVAFVDLADKQWVLYAHSGKGSSKETLYAGLSTPHIAVNPEGKEVFLFPEASTNQFKILNVSLAERQAVSFNLPAIPTPDPLDTAQVQRVEPYMAVWRPDGNRIAFYNNTGFYLTDLTTKRL